MNSGMKDKNIFILAAGLIVAVSILSDSGSSTNKGSTIVPFAKNGAYLLADESGTSASSTSLMLADAGGSSVDSSSLYLAGGSSIDSSSLYLAGGSSIDSSSLYLAGGSSIDSSSLYLAGGSITSKDSAAMLLADINIAKH